MNKPALLLTLSAALLGVFAAPAAAAPQLSTQSIIVNPTPTTLEARVWVDRDRSGNAVPNYRVGDRITLYTSVNENAYVYLFNVNPDGSTDQILPNRLSGSGNNYVRAGQTRAFPATGDRFTFDVAGPRGLNRVLVVASRRPLNLSELSSYTAGQDFATVKPTTTPGFAQALSIVVNPVEKPIPQKDWTSDTASYNVNY
ncbi:DUF4384 domain-containing protein [Deinococcus sp. HMF7604]|uniref:DUF4384 domain-containing protein n=1 Tax=Deinococcus betulae TaxID=2873312 RepID=UPI001CC8F899|nr:DUF4384 domain-containing protein [Deinococcus betulae]MBZ9749951.1 DUF4384 domain-containing protein [Deinococcus betulae]